jgi:hypothetical protein
MNNPIRFLIIILMVVHACHLPASENHRTLRFIEALEANGMLWEAITEYQRILVFAQLTPLEKGKLWLKQAIAYRSLNQEASMMNAFNQAYRYLKDSSLIDQLYKEIAVFFLSRGKTHWARLMLTRMEPRAAGYQNRFLILSHLIDENWKRFFELLESTGYTEKTINDIRRLVQKIKQNTHRIRILNVVNKIIPGLGYLFLDDAYITAETLMFHGFFISELILESSFPGKVIYALGLARMYTRALARDRNLLKRKLKERKLGFEKQIFRKIFDKGNPY